jgi:nitrogen-specific signal transduction histidine kinase/ActR/RegA family two-component response regulator
MYRTPTSKSAAYHEVTGEKSVTERKAAVQNVESDQALVEQRSQAQKMEALGTLAAGIAHDFNNMLGAIMGYASAMTREIDESHRHFSDVQQILTIARRAKRLTDKLLAFSRQSDFKVESFSINRVVRDVVGLLSRTIPKNIVIKTRLAKNIVTEGDRSLLEQVLLNVCLNSRDALPDGGQIKIETKGVEISADEGKLLGMEAGSYNQLTVSDDGLGMDPHVLRRAFEPFFTTKPAGEGSGLGLSLVYSTVKSHGGEVKIQSTPGEGTDVVVYFPVSTSRPSEGVRAVDTGERPVVGKGERILLVDDERHLRDMAKRLLEGLGYEVVLAESGEEAEAYYRDHHRSVDLVILDVVLVGLSSTETLRRLKEIHQGVKVLVSSGHSREGEPKHLLRRGVCGFIQKPYGIEEVSQAIQKALTTTPR